ncbi:MAG: prepilin-type N-terminal cleavage/methylation domain-containing protein [Epsilonproteobacteria bacterium]|nr:prepilin-type N-terminal cleavage/methylation domain-containing protein [Campylobacterota bacterium]
MRRGFTLIEIVVVVAVSAVLALGSFKALEALYLKSARARAVTELSLSSQTALDQIASLLYQRIPNSVIGYIKEDGTTACEALEDAAESYRVLEWLGMDEERLIAGYYDGFVDMNASSRTRLRAVRLNQDAMGDGGGYNLIFAGTFDGGDESVKACHGAFGWHGGESLLAYDVAFSADDTIDINDSVTPDFIYEKYYLSTGAYAVARGADVDLGGCDDAPFELSDLADVNTTLFLFYGYRPWAGETFCADPGDGTKAGRVTVLAEDVSAFSAEALNGVLRLKIDMRRAIRGDGSVHVAKQKAVF